MFDSVANALGMGIAAVVTALFTAASAYIGGQWSKWQRRTSIDKAVREGVAATEEHAKTADIKGAAKYKYCLEYVQAALALDGITIAERLLEGKINAALSDYRDAHPPPDANTYTVDDILKEVHKNAN